MLTKIRQKISGVVEPKSRASSFKPNYISFTKDEKRMLNNPLEKSVFYTAAVKELTQIIAEAWQPYFVDRNGNEVENPTAMALIDNPLGEFSRSDLAKQFSKQLLTYGISLIKIIDSGGGNFEQQIISGKYINEINVEGGVFKNANIQTDSGIKSIEIGSRTTDDFGVIALDQDILDGWSDEKIYPQDVAGKLQPLIDSEHLTREAMAFDSLQIRSPRNAFIFKQDTPKQYMDGFSEELNKGEAPQHIVLKNAQIQRLAEMVNGDVLQKRLSSIRKDILISLGIPPELFELPSSVSRILYRAVLKNFYKRAVDPVISAYNDVWNNGIASIYESSLSSAELRNRDTLPDDIDTKVARIRNLVDGDLMTINEGREELDKQPIAGGDTLRFGEPTADRIEALANDNVPTEAENNDTNP